MANSFVKKYFSSYWIRSAFYAFLQRFSLTFFGFINFVILIRSLSKPEMGAWALFLAITSVFETTKSNLLKNAHIRFVSASEEEDERSAIASSSFIINASVNLIFILLILFFAEKMSFFLHAGNELAETLRWFIPGLAAMVFFSHMEAVQQSNLDFKGNFAGYLVRQTSFFLAIAYHAVFNIPFSLRTLAIYQSVSIILGCLVLFLYTRKYFYFRFNVSGKWIRQILGYGGYIFSSGLVGNIYANVDQFMTASLLNSTSVAYYSAANRINGLIDIPSFAAAEIMFPKVSKAAARSGNDKVKYLFERMVAILLCFTIPTAIFIMIFPAFVIQLIAGKQYEAAAIILQLYMITGILRPMQNQSANILNSINKPGLCLLINSISLVACLIVNYFCLLRIGFYGAAVGTVITSVLGCTAWYFVMKKQINANLKNIIGYMIDFYKLLYNQGIALIGHGRKKRMIHR
jgi:O-antigen/teichoic acid export membrane protein